MNKFMLKKYNIFIFETYVEKLRKYFFNDSFLKITCNKKHYIYSKIVRIH